MWIELDIVEREEAPRKLMKLGIHLHVAKLLLSDTISILDEFGVKRSWTIVHNWVHKADIQPESRRSPHHIAVDKTVIQLNDEQYWLYAAVNPDTKDLLNIQFKPTTNSALADQFFADLRENMIVMS